MGSVFKSVSKAVKGVTKGFTKAVKSTVKRVKKVGKAVMKGVAKVSNKLGPIGMIALSIAMPYALGGLSSFIGSPAMAGMGGTGLMGSTNGFLQAIGNVGGAIRTGYNAFNLSVSNTFSGISKSISEGFSRFAPKGNNNIFSRISQGAKNLYTSAKETVAKYTPKPFTAKSGTVEFYGAADPGVGVMSSTDAAASIAQGNLTAGELGKQTLGGQAGLFTKANTVGNTADKFVQDTINTAYKKRLENFSPDSMRMFNDYKARTIAEKTYINDEQIGSFIENNVGTTQRTYTSAIGDTDMIGDGKTLIDTDTNLLRTGDYEALNEAGTEFQFTGKEGFKNPAFKTSDSLAKQTGDKIKKAARGFAGSLLTPKPKPIAGTPDQMPYADYSDGTQLTQAGYGGTDIKGSLGGSLVQNVFGDRAANQMRSYYKNMNLLSSMGSF